ncbi:MAG: DUF3034 family protein [Solimonas sp.]
MKVHMRGLRILQCAALLSTGLAVSQGASAEIYNDGKVLLTGSAFTVDGAGGGSAVPWAPISGYETRDGKMAAPRSPTSTLPALQVSFYGVNVSFWDRFQLSYTTARLSLNLPNLETVALVAAALAGDVAASSCKAARRSGRPWLDSGRRQRQGQRPQRAGDATRTGLMSFVRRAIVHERQAPTPRRARHAAHGPAGHPRRRTGRTAAGQRHRSR